MANLSSSSPWKVVKLLGMVEPNGEWLKDMRGNLAMAATVIATMAFQIGLNPPGGVVQNGDNGAVTCPHPHESIAAWRNQTLLACPGVTVYGALHRSAYAVFLWSNSISFFSSLVVCLFIVSGLPLGTSLPTLFLAIVMCVSLITLGITYVLGVFMVSPRRHYFQQTESTFVNLIFLIVVLGIFFMLRFVFMFVAIIADRNKSSTTPGDEPPQANRGSST